jgi:hypothetical protein
MHWCPTCTEHWRYLEVARDEQTVRFDRTKLRLECTGAFITAHNYDNIQA